MNMVMQDHQPVISSFIEGSIIYNNVCVKTINSIYQGETAFTICGSHRKAVWLSRREIQLRGRPDFYYYYHDHKSFLLGWSGGFGPSLRFLE